MDENEVQLVIKERDLAVEQYNQSKLLIEKLEQELNILTDLQPGSNKNVINIIQKEYSEVINVLRDKLKTLQDKYKEEICNSTRKDDEIRILSRRTEDLNCKLRQTEKDYYTCNNLLKQEREKYLALEKDFITTQNELFSLEKKYTCVKILEGERDQLISENHKLTNDCTELEIALEVCHQKMQSHEEEFTQCSNCLRKLQDEKKAVERNEKATKEINNELEKKIEDMSGTLKKLHEKIQKKDELFSKYVEELVDHFMIDDWLKAYEPVPRDNDFNRLESDVEEDAYLSKSDFFKLQALLTNYKQELENCMKEKYDLKVKLGLAVSNMEKYKQYIQEANYMIVSLEKMLEEQERVMRTKTNKNELQKYLNKIEDTNKELQKQIHSQEELNKKWKKEVAELITRFKNRILHLNANYKKSQKENHRLKKYLNKYFLRDGDGGNKIDNNS